MARIGTFKLAAGEYKGSISTLQIQAKSVRICPETASSGNAPTHRVFSGASEIGAAWEKRTSDDRPYLSVKLDDPAFTAPVFAQLFEGSDGEYDLIWSRQTRRGD
jgi:uncharacterized protein (DUF736 family)